MDDIKFKLVLAFNKISHFYNKTMLKLLIVFVALLSCIVANGQSIDSLLLQAYNNNPELKALQLEYEAALQKGPQVSQLPNPQLGVGIPILRPETRLGGQVLMISASQMFPWFGTLQAKEDVVLTMSKSKYEKVVATRLNLSYKIKAAYYQLYLLQEKQEILLINIRIYETLKKVVLAKIESGKTIASDVLQLELKIQELQQQVEIFETQKQIFYAQINEITNKPLTDSILIVESFNSVASIAYNLEAYQEKIKSFHPLIKQLDWQEEASQKEQKLNALSGKPSLGLGVDYSLVNQRSDAFPDKNGRDILIPKVMLSIPIYRKKYKAKNQEEQLIQESIEFRKEHLENKMLSLLQSYKSNYDEVLLNIELINTQIKTSRAAYEILLSEYSAKGNRFDELLGIQNKLLHYDLELIKEHVKSHIVKAQIERLVDF